MKRRRRTPPERTSVPDPTKGSRIDMGRVERAAYGEVSARRRSAPSRAVTVGVSVFGDPTG